MAWYQAQGLIIQQNGYFGRFAFIKSDKFWLFSNQPAPVNGMVEPLRAAQTGSPAGLSRLRAGFY
jgi:hypothetical protein